MFNVGGGEIMVILLLALLVLGPDKLPEYTRKAGRYINEFRRMTSGFQEEFRQAMDLSDVIEPPTSDPTPATGSDALDRTTEGPRLVPQAETMSPPPAPAPPAVDAGSSPDTTPVPETGPTPAAGADPTAAPSASPAPAPPPSPSPAAFTADVTPAPGTGPELITPTRPPAGHEGDAGSSSAA